MKSHHSPKEESRQEACGEVGHAADGVNAEREKLNARYQAEYWELMKIADPYERFFMGVCFFARWESAIRHGEVKTVLS